MPGLNRIRPKIDKLDKKIVKLISKRFKLTEKVALSKLKSGESINQVNRWAEVLTKLKQEAQSRGLSYIMLEKIWDELHQESKNQQERIIKSAKKK